MKVKFDGYHFCADDVYNLGWLNTDLHIDTVQDIFEAVGTVLKKYGHSFEVETLPLHKSGTRKPPLSGLKITKSSLTYDVQNGEFRWIVFYHKTMPCPMLCAKAVMRVLQGEGP